MNLINVRDLKGNEILAKDIMTWDYKIILPKGVMIRKEYIKKLIDLNITEVFVKDEEEKSGEIVILKSEMEESIKKTVKGVLERHRYHNNDELSSLSYAADEIITSIIEEEKVIDKVYDIKQRSADIYEHSISICSLSILTALKMGMEIKKIHDIGVGCLLHDIGLRYMITDYSNINVETLDKAELSEYRKHPVYGYSSLRDESWISDISKMIVLYHHERIDGSGFPLKAKELPIEVKIVNVCDAFDEFICGISCERMKVYEAIEYLKTFKNILFDGKIIDTFLSFTAVYPSGSLVLTNEGEVGIVIAQNPEFIDRPVIRIMKDKYGNDVTQDVIKDLLKIHNVFIEKTLD